MNICYSAGPGSGKTRTLVEEFERAMYEADLSSVVAVTFTDKAANEMIERVARRLKEKNAERFTDFITSHRIGTIHSFCLSILKNYRPVTEIIDDKMSAVLRDRAVTLCLGELPANSEILLDNFGYDLMERLLRGSLEKRYLHALHLPDEDGYLAMNDRALYELTAGSIGRIKEISESRGIGDHMSFYSEILHYDSLDLGEKLSVIEKILDLDCGSVPFRGTGIAEERKDLRDVMRTSMLTSGNYKGLISYERTVLGALLGALERVGEIYGSLKEGRKDFDDILLETFELMKERPEIAEEEGRRIRFLFVDEFQDVDPLQYGIFEMLQRGNKKMQVLVFGDPKQSIYSFRGADVEVFNRVAKEYEQRPLDRNYRSTPTLIRFFNCVTQGVFSENAERYLTPYQRLEADRAEFPSEIGFDIAIRDEEDSEAEVIAARISSIVGTLDVSSDFGTRKADYGDIAVLVDDTTRLSELTRALTKHGIPYQISSGSGFFEAPEVKTLMNLLSVLEDNGDDVALFGLLRSEMFHLSDADIYEISLREGRRLYDKIPPEIRKDLDRWSGLVDILSPSDIVSLVLRERSYRGIMAMGDRRRVAMRNINRFVALLRSFESSGIRTMRTVSDMLVRFADMKAKEPESSMPEADCVSIMTIHKAKGLEWPIVIVPYIYKRYRSNSEDLPVRGDAIGIKTNLKQYSPERRESLIYVWLKKEEQERYEEERKRLLYVAMTRAKDHLFFTGCLNVSQQRKDPCWARNILDKSLNLTQIAVSSSVGNSRLSFRVEFGDAGRMWLRRVIVAHGRRGAEEKERRVESMRFVGYIPRERKVVIDPSYAGLLFECPMKYHLARDLGIGEDLLSSSVPELRREADGRFYGSVVHRALELLTAQPRRIVEEMAMEEGIELSEEILEEGVERIEDARSALERSELKDLVREAVTEVELFRDFGDFCIKGRADLFIPEKNMVVDYKTDVDLTQRINEYKIQLTLYSICLNDARAYIYAVREGLLLPVDVDRAELLEDLKERMKDLRGRKRAEGEHCTRCFYRRICGAGVIK